MSVEQSVRFPKIELTPETFSEMLFNNKGVLFLKFGASWCNPCKTIQPYVVDFAMKCPGNIKCYDIDVDESFELYAYLKRFKMARGVPVILCYYKGTNTYICDDSCVGSNIEELKGLFQRITEKAKTLQSNYENLK